jgi:hypothetical protein
MQIKLDKILNLLEVNDNKKFFEILNTIDKDTQIEIESIKK